MGCSNFPEVKGRQYFNPYLSSKNSNIIIDRVDNSKTQTIPKINEEEKHAKIEDIKEIEEIANKMLIGGKKIIDFKELFIDFISSEFLALLKDSNKLIHNQKFFEGLSYEYGLMGQTNNKGVALKSYIDGANLQNDYLCMFRLYRIYLNDYEKFYLKKNIELEKLYLYKCIAYLPYSIINGNFSIFNRINISYEISILLDNNDSILDSFEEDIKNFKENKEKYELSKNNINLMNYFFKAYFISYKYKNIIKDFLCFSKGEKEKEKESYYESRLKYNNYQLDFYENTCDKEIIETNFKLLINEKYYKACYDYGNYLIKQKKYDEAKNILKLGMDNAQQFCLSLYIYLVLRDIKLNQILSDYHIISDILKKMCLSICFEKLNMSSFFYTIYYLSKHSSFKNELQNNFIKYISEIYNNFKKNSEIINDIESDLRYKIEVLFIFGQMCYYGISDNIKPDKSKALIYFKKSYELAKKNTNNYSDYKRNIYIYIYKCRKYLFKKNKIKEEKINKTKGKLIKLYTGINKSDLTIFEHYIYYKLYKDTNIAEKYKAHIIRLLKNAINNNMFYNFKDYVYKEKCQIVLKEYSNICNICYDKLKEIVLKTCEHVFCKSCFTQLENKQVCPICGVIIETNNDEKK